MTTLYTKRGRRYHPVGEYSNEAVDMLPYGHHLITVSPGRRLATYQVNPDHAGLLVAIQQHEKVLVAAIQEASSRRIEARTVTAKERRAIKAYYDIMGPDGMLMITRSNALNILDGLKRAIIATRRLNHKSDIGGKHENNSVAH